RTSALRATEHPNNRPTRPGRQYTWRSACSIERDILKKCVLRPTTRVVYLGIVCDSETCRFEVPEDKLERLETLITT
ncbi:unnamed protein product, partial [Laminaria digitata]